MFEKVSASTAERAERRPGDGLVAPADVVMDRAFTVPGTPADVWPWIAQLGKRRAGWYLPRRIERFLPPSRRAGRTVEPRWQRLAVGDVIPDYGGRHASFTVAEIDPPHTLVYSSRRRAMLLTWSIVLRPAEGPGTGTRVLLRLRLAPVKRRRLAGTAGELLDLLTIAGLATGLRERLVAAAASRP